jgi:hypothetical protein
MGVRRRADVGAFSEWSFKTSTCMCSKLLFVQPQVATQTFENVLTEIISREMKLFGFCQTQNYSNVAHRGASVVHY